MDLIKTKTNESGEIIVSGRELHQFLGVNSNYTTWMDRMIGYGFVENQDYIAFWSDSKNGNAVQQLGSPQQMTANGYRTDHAIKIDMAKEISMIQRNEKGKQARQYFIEIEKRYKTIDAPSYMIEDPIERAKAWIREKQQQQQLELENKIYQQQIAEAQPKLTYVDMVLKCPDLLTTTQIADDYGMSARRFNTLLNKHGIQYRQSGQWLLYSKYKGQGYTKSDTTPYRRSDGSEGVSILTKWTQKGRLFLYEELKKKGLLPTIEVNLIA